MPDMKALAKAGVDAAVHSTAMTLSPDVVASLVLNGDLSKLTGPQKVNYYNSLCQRVGLDPATQPFKLLRLNGKEVMYADKGAAQQLSQVHKISHDVVSREKDDDIYTVTIRASMPDGRFTVEDGSVFIGSLTGEALANAKMKAVTKGKRRAVLALMGLGMSDESEVETIEGAEIVQLDAVAAIAPHPETEPKEAPLSEASQKFLEPAKEGGDANEKWFQNAKLCLIACVDNSEKEKARDWGVVAFTRVSEGKLSRDRYNELRDIFLAAYPPTPEPLPWLFDAKGNPIPAITPAPKPEPKPKKAAAKKAAASKLEGLTADVEAAEKLSMLFTLKGRINKADLSEAEKGVLLAALEAKLKTVREKKK